MSENHPVSRNSQQTGDNRSKKGSSLSSIWETIPHLIPNRYVIPLSGGLAGAVAGVVCCPLDVIKTKLQAQGGFKDTRLANKTLATQYRGVLGSAATIWREEGPRGMYRGLMPMLLGYVPTWAVYLTVYNKSQKFFQSKTDNCFIANVYASLLGGACSTLTTNPIWVIKTRLMSQSSRLVGAPNSQASWYYHNTWDAAQKIYRKEGLIAFYSGLTPALLGLAHVAIQFPLYEILKENTTGIRRGSGLSDESREHHFVGLAFAVFLSKVCASTATYPHEVVRTRLQTQQYPTSRGTKSPQFKLPYAGSQNLMDKRFLDLDSVPRSTWMTCRLIYFENGWRGFYAGLGTNLIRAVPSAMTTILTFEYLKRNLTTESPDLDCESSVL